MTNEKPQRAGRGGKPYVTSASWFKRRRDALGLTQEQLAAKAAVSQSLVSQLEDGKHPPTLVRFDRLSRILNALQSTVADMLEHANLEREAWPTLGSLEGPGYNTRRIPVFDGDDAPNTVSQVGEVDIPAKWVGEYMAYRIKPENMLTADVSMGTLAIVRQGGRYRLGDNIAAWVPDRGMVTKALCIDTDEQMVAYEAKEFGPLVAPGAVLIGKVRELRVHIADPNGW